MLKSPEEFIPTRRSLLSRLKEWDDHESWRDFFNTYWKLVYGVALKSGLSETEAQEVVQETVISVAKKMHDFKYDPAIGSFKGWLLHLTRYRIVDQFRKRPKERIFSQPPADQTAQTDVMERIPDPDSLNLDAVWDDEWRKNLVDAALARVKRQITPRQYQIFDFYVLREKSVSEVARTLGVTATSVYLAKLRVGRLLGKEIKKLESEIL